MPIRCIGCLKYIDFEPGPICQQCLLNIPVNNSLLCPICQQRLIIHQNELIQCPTHKHQSSLSFLACATSFNDHRTQKLIHLFKYKNLKSCAPPLSQIIMRYLEQIKLEKLIDFKDWAIVPIPLTKNKLRQRGYNQSEIIGTLISNQIKMLIIQNALIKTKESRPQAQTKTKIERIENVKNSFGIQNNALIKNKKIILLDDVITTGSTISEAARALKKAGASDIVGLTIALG